ncbi:carboxylesterase/lipase family protein, partial [Streptomyces sp. SID11385]|nr:carboxylesterase/lipase family protein [Streptomyces sp. SID11385]
SRLGGLDLRTARHRDPLLGLSPFGPVLDTQPAHALATPAPGLLIGTNSEEGNLYSVPFGTHTSDTAADVLATARAAHPDPARLLAHYAEARPDATPGETRAAVRGAALFRAGSRALAEAATAAGTPTFAYE